MPAIVHLIVHWAPRAHSAARAVAIWRGELNVEWDSRIGQSNETMVGSNDDRKDDSAGSGVVTAPSVRQNRNDQHSSTFGSGKVRERIKATP